MSLRAQAGAATSDSADPSTSTPEPLFHPDSPPTHTNTHTPGAPVPSLTNHATQATPLRSPHAHRAAPEGPLAAQCPRTSPSWRPVRVRLVRVRLVQAPVQAPVPQLEQTQSRLTRP